MLYILIQNTFLDLFGFRLKIIKYTFFSGTKSQLIHENDKHRIVYKVCKKKLGCTKQPENKNLNLYSIVHTILAVLKKNKKL